MKQLYLMRTNFNVMMNNTVFNYYKNNCILNTLMDNSLYYFSTKPSENCHIEKFKIECLIIR